MTSKKTTKKVDVNSIVNEAIKDTKELSEYHNNLVASMKIMLAKEVENSIYRHNFDLSLESEQISIVTEDMNAIEERMSSTEDSIIYNALSAQYKSCENQLEELYCQIQDNKDSKESKPIESAEDFQAKIDIFFANGLHGLKVKKGIPTSQLVLTEAEATISGTSAVNYLCRQELQKQSTNIHYDTFKDNIKALTGRHLKSNNHFDYVMKQAIKAGLIASYKYIQSHGKTDAFWQVNY